MLAFRPLPPSAPLTRQTEEVFTESNQYKMKPCLDCQIHISSSLQVLYIQIVVRALPIRPGRPQLSEARLMACQALTLSLSTDILKKCQGMGYRCFTTMGASGGLIRHYIFFSFKGLDFFATIEIIARLHYLQYV